MVKYWVLGMALKEKENNEDGQENEEFIEKISKNAKMKSTLKILKRGV